MTENRKQKKLTVGNWQLAIGKIKLALAYCLLHTIICSSFAYALGTPPPKCKPNYIRVAIVQDAFELTLSIKGRYKIVRPHTNEILIKGNSLRKARVLPAASGIKVNKYLFKIYAIKIKPERKAAIFLNRYRLRGDLELIRQKNRTLLAVNEVDIEDYLRGVLREEVSPHWPMEALKAQAVAARTFALYQDCLNKDKDYGLDRTVYSQLYGGVRQETWRTNRAVRETAGEVLTYKGKIFPAFFHATCGGHTEDASELWNIDIPPLKGVNCPFCKRSPHYSWRVKIPLSQIKESLNKKGYKISRISHISAIGRSKSGRVKKVKISGDKEIRVEANEFRLIVGADLIRSTNFKIALKNKNLLVQGLGWGHGVGLCQWGAYFMARRGFDYRQILEYYYPGAKLTQLHSNAGLQ